MEQQSEESTELAVDTKHISGVSAAIDSSLALVGDVLGAVARPALHNFGGDAKHQWRLTAIAGSPKAIKADELQGRIINLKYFYAHRVEIENPTNGEINDCCRCVLIDDKDQPYAFVSDGIARSLGDLIRVYGLKPYDKPIPVKVEIIPTKPPKRTYRIVPA